MIKVRGSGTVAGPYIELSPLDQQTFCKGPDNKYFRLCGPYGQPQPYMVSVGTIQLCHFCAKTTIGKKTTFFLKKATIDNPQNRLL